MTAFNADPTAKITSHADGDTVQEGFAEVLRGSVGDPDNRTDNLTVAWFAGGEAVCLEAAPDDDGVTSCELVFSPDAGDVVLEVRDPGGGAGSDTLELDVLPADANTVPTVSTPSLAPSTVYTNDTLTANVTASDAEGDTLTVTYDWYVDGSSVQDGADNTLSGVTLFDKDQDVFVIVTADDGTDTTTATSATVTVSNTPPAAPVVTIDPTDPVEGEDLYCEVTTASTDADGDAITYSMAWTVDGVSYSSALTTTWTDDTVSGDDVVKGETWECVVTPNDDDDDGATATASAQVCYGSQSSCPGLSCQDILDNGFDDGDKTYWIDPDSSGALEVYCDMTSDGGGWTLVAVVANGYSSTGPSNPFFTENVEQTSTAWMTTSTNPVDDPSGRGVLDVTSWTTPEAIRYRMVETSTNTVLNTLIASDTSSVAHLQTYSTGRASRPGSATVDADAPSTASRTVYYASDNNSHWGYDAIFGRKADTNATGWQFGVSVNKPDNVAGYDGVHDDQYRTEYNLGVAGTGNDVEISGYWPGYCTSSCKDEDWSYQWGDDAARVQVWHR